MVMGCCSILPHSLVPHRLGLIQYGNPQPFAAVGFIALGCTHNLHMPCLGGPLAFVQLFTREMTESRVCLLPSHDEVRCYTVPDNQETGRRR